ncbi:MAG: HAD family hydrolase [Limisphaerales bacterium]
MDTRHSARAAGRLPAFPRRVGRWPRRALPSASCRTGTSICARCSRRWGWRGVFDVIGVSCETPFAKPSPVMFEVAVRGLGLAPGELLHGGDSPAEDVAGAQAAGRMAWHAGTPPDGDGPLRELAARLAEAREWAASPGVGGRIFPHSAD